MQKTFKKYKPRYKQLKERKTFKDHKTNNFETFFDKKYFSSKLARPRTSKFSKNICKSIKLTVTENQIDWGIQTDVVKKVPGIWNPSP